MKNSLSVGLRATDGSLESAVRVPGNRRAPRQREHLAILLLVSHRDHPVGAIAQLGQQLRAVMHLKCAAVPRRARIQGS